jgi:hypothetical protein
MLTYADVWLLVYSAGIPAEKSLMTTKTQEMRVDNPIATTGASVRTHRTCSICY